MPSDPTYTPAPTKRRRKRKSIISPAVLTLVSANYSPDYATLTLVFNQPINSDSVVWPTISVNDEVYTGSLYRGVARADQTADSVTIELEVIGPPTGTVITMTIEPGNNITAVNGGEVFGGVTDLALPFP